MYDLYIKYILQSMIARTSESHGDLHHKIVRFFENHIPFSVPPETILISSTTRPSFIFFLREGVVQQTVTTIKGNELCLNLYKPGSFFSLMDGLADIPNSYTFTSILSSSGWKAPIEEVKHFIAQNPDVSTDLTIRLLKGLHGLLSKTEKLMEGNALGLLVQTLLSLGTRFSLAGSSDVIITVPFTHQKLAELTGLSRETVTRELSFLKSKHLVSIDAQHITLHNVDQLQSLLDV